MGRPLAFNRAMRRKAGGNPWSNIHSQIGKRQQLLRKRAERQPEPKVITRNIEVAYCMQNPRYAELRNFISAVVRSREAKDGQSWRGYEKALREHNLLKKEILSTLPFGPIIKD